MSRSWRCALVARGSACARKSGGSAIGVTLLLSILSACGDGSPATSSLLWDDFYPGPSPGVSSASARDVAACDGSYFVIGETRQYFLIRAYDTKDGTLRWQHDQPFEETGFAGGVACGEGRVYASGRRYTQESSAFVRAYDSRTGDMLWEVVVEEEDGSRDVDLAFADSEVVLLTKSGDATVLDVWTIDASTGDLRWRARDAGADDPSVQATLRVTRELACVLRDSGSSPLLRCLDRENGKVAWYAADVGEPGIEVESRPGSKERFLAFGRRDYLSGVVAAYDPRTGELLWSRDDFHYIFDVHAYGDLVLVVSADFDVFDPDQLRFFFRVTALDSRGETRWVNTHLDEGVHTSAILAGKLFVTWESWQTRVYDPETGRLLVEQDAEATPRSRLPSDIAADGDRFAMVGATYRNSVHKDFAVRAYELSP